MVITRVRAENFKNLDNVDITLNDKVNVLYGKNAQGKTNLLEAIAYLGSGKAFRTQKTAELVRLHAEFAQIAGEVYSQERQQSLRWILYPAARPRRLFRNGVKKKSAADISGVLQTVLFCPEDLMVLKTGAAARRRSAFQDGQPAALRVFHTFGVVDDWKVEFWIN